MSALKPLQLKPALALLLLALGGCAVGPDYRAPTTALPGEYTAAVPAAQATAPLKKAWWTLFQDAQLNALVATAQAHNHDLLAAIARVEEAEGLAREANALFYPSLDLSAGAGRSKLTDTSTPRLRDSRRATLNTAFEIDLWGRLRRANEAARAEILASRYARDTLELSIASLTASGYLALRAADASVALTTETLASRQKALEIAKSRMDAGKASPLDFHQAEGAVAAAQSQLSTFKRQRALAENQLALLTGQPGLTLARGDLRQLPMPPIPPAGLPSALIEARPDIRQAEELLVSANARIGVAKAALFPTLSLTGTLGSESAELSNLFSSGAQTWNIGLGLIFSVFDAGRKEAQIDQVSARQKQVLANYQKTVETAFKEVNDALITLHEGAEGEKAETRRVEAAQKTLSLAEIRYAAGYSPFIEVLDAQRNTNDAQLAYVAQRQSRLTAAVSLFKALGGGWQDDFKADSLKNSGADKAQTTQ